MPLDELIAVDLVRSPDTPRRFRFRRPIVRRAVYEATRGGWRNAVRDQARIRGRRDQTPGAMERATARFWAGCNTLSGPFIRASQSSDHAVEPKSAPEPHRVQLKLDPVSSPCPWRH